MAENIAQGCGAAAPDGFSAGSGQTRAERTALAELCGTVANGYLLLYLNVNLEFGSGVLNLLPAWAGYLRLGSALTQLEKQVPEAALLRPLCHLLAAWNVLDWLCALLGADSGRLPFLPLVAAVAGLYFHFQLLTNLAQAARPYLPGQSGRLLDLRTVQTLFLTLTSLLAPFGAAGTGAAAYLSVFLLIAAALTAFALWQRLRSIKRALLEEAE